MIPAWSREGVAERQLSLLTGWLTGDVLRQVYIVVAHSELYGMHTTLWNAFDCLEKRPVCWKTGAVPRLPVVCYDCHLWSSSDSSSTLCASRLWPFLCSSSMACKKLQQIRSCNL